jgi:5-methyltetrahydrofolate--homocysteine methyltransferase
METKICSQKREVIISDKRPTVLIGEKLNPTNRKELIEALKSSELEIIKREALNQVEDGADVLDINVGVPGVDEVTLLPIVVKLVSDCVDVPLCLDSSNPDALDAALVAYQGKAIINSVNGDEESLNSILPLVKKYDAAVIGLLMDRNGIPNNVDGRLQIADNIMKRASQLGIPKEDVIFDCVGLSIGTNTRSGLLNLETIKRVKQEFGANMTLGISNISFGMPDRNRINATFLSIAISEGVTCPIVDAAKTRPVALAVDLVLGRDHGGAQYLRDCRKRHW